MIMIFVNEFHARCFPYSFSLISNLSFIDRKCGHFPDTLGQRASNNCQLGLPSKLES
jgi:hypothetical protein